jgi:hypothetical protein
VTAIDSINGKQAAGSHVLDHGAETTRRCSLVDERLLVTMEHFIVEDVTMELV